MRTKLTKLDNEIFMSLNTFNKEERTVLLKHMKELMVQVHAGDITIDETMETLKGLLVSINKLKQSR